MVALPTVRVVVALGQIAHVAAARALGLPPASTKFGHGGENIAPDGRILLSSYHCSRYNQNTRRPRQAMFESVFERALALKCPRWSAALPLVKRRLLLRPERLSHQ